MGPDTFLLRNIWTSSASDSLNWQTCYYLSVFVILTNSKDFLHIRGVAGWDESAGLGRSALGELTLDYIYLSIYLLTLANEASYIASDQGQCKGHHFPLHFERGGGRRCRTRRLSRALQIALVPSRSSKPSIHQRSPKCNRTCPSDKTFRRLGTWRDE